MPRDVARCVLLSLNDPKDVANFIKTSNSSRAIVQGNDDFWMEWSAHQKGHRNVCKYWARENPVFLRKAFSWIVKRVKNASVLFDAHALNGMFDIAILLQDSYCISMCLELTLIDKNKQIVIDMFAHINQETLDKIITTFETDLEFLTLLMAKASQDYAPGCSKNMDLLISRLFKLSPAHVTQAIMTWVCHKYRLNTWNCHILYELKRLAPCVIDTFPKGVIVKLLHNISQVSTPQNREKCIELLRYTLKRGILAPNDVLEHAMDNAILTAYARLYID